MNFTPKVPLNSSGEYAKLDGLSHLHHGPDGADSFHLDSSPQDGHLRVINVPDAHLLFSGDYTRSGSDLILSDVCMSEGSGYDFLRAVQADTQGFGNLLERA